MMSKQMVSIIVLNYNGGKVLLNCIVSLLGQTYKDFEIILVDNHSTDGSIEEIDKKFRDEKKIKIIKNESNLGCPGGRNVGIKHANGQIIGFIDNDAIADENWLYYISKKLESNKKIGVVSSRLIFSDKRCILNGVGGTLNLQGYGGDIGFNEPVEFFKLPEKIFYACGCGMVIRKDVIDRVGEFDTPIFNYYDDVDFCFRARNRGYDIVLEPEAVLYHKFSYSDKFNKNKVFLCERNRIRCILKYKNINDIPLWMKMEIFHEIKNFILFPIFLWSWIWNIVHIHDILKTRFAESRLDKSSIEHKLFDPTWGYYPPAIPNNSIFRPNVEKIDNILEIGKDCTDHLNYGWYNVEKDKNKLFRWSHQIGSIYFKLDKQYQELIIEFMISENQKGIVNLLIRGDKFCRDIKLERSLYTQNVAKIKLDLKAGVYEIIFISQDTFKETYGTKRELGIAISKIVFE